MRLEPSDKPMYHRMDQRDRALIMIPVFGIAPHWGCFSCGPFSGHHRVDHSSDLVCVVCLKRNSWKLKQLIMPLSG